MLIIKYLNFFGYNEDDLLAGLDVMPEALMEKIYKM